jgi:hypothetical protein
MTTELAASDHAPPGRPAPFLSSVIPIEPQ